MIIPQSSMIRRSHLRRAARIGVAALLFTLSAVARAQQPSPPILPDPKLTPGATLPVTVDDIKVPGYTKKVRNVPKGVKDQVYAEYGITSHKAGEYEVDHLISLELGGSNSIRNLWPESYKTKPWNAHVKDQLENKLHDLVVAGQMTLPDAQRMIAGDWVAAYKEVFQADTPMTAAQARRRGVRTEDETDSTGAEAPSTRAATPSIRRTRTADGPSAAAPPTAAPGGQVWVNTKSGKYFQPGSRYYGRTKQGQYMTEDAAKRAGYVAAGR